MKGHPLKILLLAAVWGAIVVGGVLLVSRIGDWIEASPVEAGSPASSAAAPASRPALPGSISAVVPPLPLWIPVPPGARLTAHLPAPPDGGNGEFRLAAALSWADTVHFFEGRLQGAGYAVTRNDVVGGAGRAVVVTGSLDAPDPSRRTVQLTITEDGRGAQVSGTYGNGVGSPPEG